MQPTEKSVTALLLGQAIGFLQFKAFGENYTSFRKDIDGFVREIGFEVTLPDTYEQYLQKENELIREMRNHIEHERKQLGGDVYVLPIWILGRILLPMVVNWALKGELTEEYTALFGGVLSELDISDEFEDLKSAVQLETEWLRERADLAEGAVSISDCGQATTRLVTRVFTLWGLGKKFDTQMHFSKAPFYSVFISYSTVDQEFCDRIYEALSDAGVRMWYAPHDIQPGQKIHSQVRRAIQRQDKLLIAISDASMSSEWVQTELYHARQREVAEKNQLLFPVSLVPYEKLKEWSAFDADTGRDMAREIREYYIPDFSNWKDEKAFSESVGRLIESLVETEET